MTVINQVRAYLQDKCNGKTYIPIGTMDDFIASSGIAKPQFLAAFYRMMSKGELATDKSATGMVKGITLKKMPSVSTILRNEAAKAKETPVKPIKLHTSSDLSHISAYLNKKRVIGEVAEKLKEAGLDAEATLKFEPEPLGEESLILLSLIEQAQTAINDLHTENQKLKIDLEAATAINKRYEDKLKLKLGDYAESTGSEPASR